MFNGGARLKYEGRVLQEQDKDSNKWELSPKQSRQQNTDIMKIVNRLTG